ncbi:MFS transporter [Salinibacterium hongtaonis]|uniref:MFS transporter n=1 Tax=Homoserinimonas hongtaonis TaxID=2079791 RepID=UPI000D33DE06|nr:MFS transporter [Salinibacterium hongtaonis]AWB88463.1 hypothetical protein C2138_01895 [Salinibacterium hongtaonis]
MRARLPGEREQTILVCALIGAAQMTWGSIVPVLPLFMEQFGLGVVMLGPVIAAFAVGRVVANIPAGLALRWWRPRWYLHSVLIALALVTAVTGFAAAPGFLIAARVLAGVLGGAAVTIGFAVLVAGAPAERRGRAMATATVVQMGAAAVGSLVGGIAVTYVGVQGAFIASAVPLLLVIGWDVLRPAAFYWDAHTRSVSALDVEHQRGPAPRARLSGGWGLLAALAGVSFAAFFARFAGEQGLIPVMAYGEGGMTPIGLGIALAAGTVASLLVLGPVGRWVDRGARTSVVLVSAVAASAVLIALPMLGEPFGFAVAVVLYSVATSVTNIVPGVVTGEQYTSREVGTVVGITRTAGDAGAAIGPLVVFALAATSAIAGLVVMAAVLLVASAMLCAVMIHKSAR